MESVKRALLSVSDKRDLVAFAQRLAAMGVELVSTGGTARVLRESGLSVIAVDEVTGFPEMMGGRVKTLHPAVHGAILARRDLASDVTALREHDLTPIDLVVVNLYPFEQTVARDGATHAEIIEQIDIGGPSMVRSAAKNHRDVAVVTSPSRYDAIIVAMESHGGTVPLEMREELAAEAFLHTAQYDATIARYMSQRVDSEEGSEQITPAWGTVWGRSTTLRYGENPHQQAGLYLPPGEPTGLARAEVLQGKALSYNNWMDMDAAYALAADLGPDGVVIVKHANPCGAARSVESLLAAYTAARACDPVSAFGGIVATRGVIDAALAETLTETFLEVILASEITEAARAILARKKRLRVLTLDSAGWGKNTALQPRPIAGGLLLQTPDTLGDEVRTGKVVTERQPTKDEWASMAFGWVVCKHVKSNAIIFSEPDRTAAIGAGQMSRVDSSKIAVMKSTASLTGTSLASDAFFPFADGVIAAADAGATAVVQPGGSIRDEEVIEAANARGMAMVFTGRRHFRH